MKSLRSPLITAALLFSIALVVPIAIAGLFAVLAPDVQTLTARLVAVLVMAALALVVVLIVDRRMLRLTWCSPRLVAILVVIALAPFVTGLRGDNPSTALVLVVGYAATGLYEELWFRGLILGSLSGRGMLPAALLSSALFGLAHLSNIAFGADPAITATQVVGAFCFGIGYAAVRLRGLSLWMLAATHALTDIGLALTNIEGAWRWIALIGGDTVLLVVGLVVLLRVQAGRRG